MGVDVSAISNARRARKHDRSGDWCFKHHTYVSNSALPSALDGRPEGCYCSKQGDLGYWGFRAGSYSGYNEFRDELSQLGIGIPVEELWRSPTQYDGEPFAELLLIPSENAIGPVTSGKLYKDFNRYVTAARRRWRKKSDAWLLENYLNFRKAFRIAKDGGFVLLR